MPGRRDISAAAVVYMRSAGYAPGFCASGYTPASGYTFGDGYTSASGYTSGDGYTGGLFTYGRSYRSQVA